MNWVFVVDIIVGLAGLITLGVGIFLLQDGHYAKRIGVFTLIGGVVILFFSCMTSVPAQSVGVVTSFGKPITTFDPGLHWKSPWMRVIDMDGKIQIDDNLGEHRTEIRLANGSNAFVQNALRWKIKQDQADDLWRDYREFNRISTGLVDQELADALNVAFSNYDPISAAQIQTDPKKPVPAQKGYDEIAEQIKNRLITRLPQIDIVSVIIPKVDFDEHTQARIDSYQQEKVNTKIATQRVATAEQDKLAAQKLSQGYDQDSLIARCQDMVKAVNGNVPIGFSCWPGQSNTPPVITQQR